MTHLTPSRRITNEDDYKKRLNCNELKHWAIRAQCQKRELECKQLSKIWFFFPFPIPIVEYGFKKGLIAPEKWSFISAENTHNLHREVMTHLLPLSWMPRNGTATSHQVSPLTVTSPFHPKGSSNERVRLQVWSSWAFISEHQPHYRVRHRRWWKLSP